MRLPVRLAGRIGLLAFSGAVAAVATVGYTGFVWSPLLLGWIADTVDLRAAMGVIVFATVGITITGFFAGRNPPG